MKKSTLKDISVASGFSNSTVSKALNNKLGNEFIDEKIPTSLIIRDST